MDVNWLTIAPIIFRGTERIIVVFFGGLAVYWGYRLFDRETSNGGELLAKNGQISVALKKIGPGVFFALFGMIILSLSLYFQIRTTSGINDANQKEVAASPGPGVVDVLMHGAPVATDTDTKNKLEAIQALTTVIKLKGTAYDAKEKQDLNAALNQINELRFRLINQVYGDGAIERYSEWAELARKNPQFSGGLSPKDLSLFKNVKEALGE